MHPELIQARSQVTELSQKLEEAKNLAQFVSTLDDYINKRGKDDQYKDSLNDIKRIRQKLVD